MNPLEEASPSASAPTENKPGKAEKNKAGDTATEPTGAVAPAILEGFPVDVEVRRHEETGRNWEPLVPLDDPQLPSLDPSFLPLWAGDFASALAAFTETPPELAVGMVLAACAVACARRFKVEIAPGYFEPTNLWICVALPSGSRKSATLNAATAPLRKWEQLEGERTQEKIQRKTAEMMAQLETIKRLEAKVNKAKDVEAAKPDIEEIARIKKNLVEIPTPPRLWTSDSTPEHLGTLIADHGERMAWISSEGGIFETVGGRYSKGIPNLDLMLKAHAGDPERVDRVSRPSIFLDFPRLTICLTPQPSVLQGLASRPEFRGRGLLARFLYLIPRSNLGFRTHETAPIRGAVQSGYACGLLAMLNTPVADDDDGEGYGGNSDGLYVLRLREEAREKFEEFRRAVEVNMRPGERLEYAKDWAGKAPGAAVRIAAVLHCIKHAHGKPWEHEIDKETMADALEIMAIFIAHSRQALASMGADEGIAAAEKVWGWIKHNRKCVCTERELFNALRGTFHRVDRLRDALHVLEERGYIHIERQERDGPGRPPSPHIVVRPDLAKGWP